MIEGRGDEVLVDEESSPTAAALRRVLAGYAFASVAVGTTGVAVAVVLFDRSGSTAWATVGAVARVAPFVVFGALAGLVAGRLPAQRTLLAAAMAQVVAATALLAAASSAPLAIVACVSVAAHVAWTAAYPSIVSLVPRLVPSASIASANGWLATLESLAWIVGPGVGGVVIAAADVEAAAAMAIGCGAIAMVCLAPGAATRAAAADGSAGFVAPTGTPSVGTGSNGTLTALSDGVRLVTGNPSTLGAVVLHLLADLVAGAVAVLLIVVAAERLGFGDGGYGVLSAAAAAGAFGALVLVRRLARTARPASLLAGAVLASGAPIALLALIDAPAPALVLVALSGLGGVMAEVIALTTVQRTVPERFIAQVVGLLDTVSIGAFVAGTLAAGPLVELVGLDVALVAVGAIVPAVGVLVSPLLLRGAERSDRLVLLPGVQLIAGVSVVSLLYARAEPAVATGPEDAGGPGPPEEPPTPGPTTHSPDPMDSTDSTGPSGNEPVGAARALVDDITTAPASTTPIVPIGVIDDLADLPAATESPTAAPDELGWLTAVVPVVDVVDVVVPELPDSLLIGDLVDPAALAAPDDTGAADLWSDDSWIDEM